MQADFRGQVTTRTLSFRMSLVNVMLRAKMPVASVISCLAKSLADWKPASETSMSCSSLAEREQRANTNLMIAPSGGFRAALYGVNRNGNGVVAPLQRAFYSIRRYSGLTVRTFIAKFYQCVRKRPDVFLGLRHSIEVLSADDIRRRRLHQSIQPAGRIGRNTNVGIEQCLVKSLVEPVRQLGLRNLRRSDGRRRLRLLCVG